MKKILFISISMFFLLSCKKKEEVTISDVPEISIVSISPGTVKEYEDPITIRIAYTDGNGDLGENNPDVKNVFVTDTRINATYGFRLQELSPEGSDISIKGEFDVLLDNTGITDGSSFQSVSYDVYVVDRAGQKSNIATTTAVNVVK